MTAKMDKGTLLWRDVDSEIQAYMVERDKSSAARRRELLELIDAAWRVYEGADVEKEDKFCECFGVMTKEEARGLYLGMTFVKRNFVLLV